MHWENLYIFHKLHAFTVWPLIRSKVLVFASNYNSPFSHFFFFFSNDETKKMKEKTTIWKWDDWNMHRLDLVYWIQYLYWIFKTSIYASSAHHQWIKLNKKEENHSRFFKRFSKMVRLTLYSNVFLFLFSFNSRDRSDHIQTSQWQPFQMKSCSNAI